MEKINQILSKIVEYAQKEVRLYGKDVLEGHKVVVVATSEDATGKVIKIRPHRKTKPISKDMVDRIQNAKKLLKDSLSLANLMILLIRTEEELRKIKEVPVSLEEASVLYEELDKVYKLLEEKRSQLLITERKEN